MNREEYLRRRERKKKKEGRFLEEVEKRIIELGELGNEARKTPFYKVLKDGLANIGYWKAHPRGDAKKAYQAGWGKHRNQ